MRTARDIIADNLPVSGAPDELVADTILSALTAAGYRLIGPGELDAESLEKAAEVVEEQIGPNAIADSIRALKGEAQG